MASYAKTDCRDSAGVIKLAKDFPNTKASKFLDWFLFNDNIIEGQSMTKLMPSFKAACFPFLNVTRSNICSIFTLIFSAVPVKFIQKILVKAVYLLLMFLILARFWPILKICLNPPLRKS